MPNVSIAFHSPNETLGKSLGRLVKGLNGHKAWFAKATAHPEEIEFNRQNFFFGAVAGSPEEIWAGLRMLKFAQANLRVLGKIIPMGIVADTPGFEAWKKGGLIADPIRLVVRIGEPGTFPDVTNFVCRGAKRVDVRGFGLVEDELARVRAALEEAVLPFPWSGM